MEVIRKENIMTDEQRQKGADLLTKITLNTGNVAMVSTESHISEKADETMNLLREIWLLFDY